MFFNDENLILVDISNFNTENLNNLDCLFFGCISLNSIKLPKSNNPNLLTMNNMFSFCSELISIDL